MTLTSFFGALRGLERQMSHLRSLGATMSQKSSVPQAASFVSVVLKRDIPLSNKM